MAQHEFKIAGVLPGAFSPAGNQGLESRPRPAEEREC
jgi:hypothetical protein